jgi:multidrug efflux system outer membrane protein
VNRSAASVAALRLLTAALVFGLLQACAIEPEPWPELLTAPPTWQGKAGTGHLEADWWTAFGDPVMSNYVTQALANNQDLQLASARVAEARALTSAQHGSELPAVVFGGTAGRSDSISAVTRNPYLSTAWQEQLQISYEVDLWGRIHALGDAADATLKASEASRDAAALAVASTTASAYISLRALDQRLDLARKTLESREAALSFARSRQKQGYASKLELAQAESEYRATAQVVPQLNQAISRTEHAVRLLVGLPPGPVERGTVLDALALPAMPDAGVPSDLLRRRPDIAASEDLVAASDARLAASKAQLLPSLKLTGAIGTAGASVFTGDPFTLWSLGGSVLAPIFNGGELRAQVRAGSARRDQALIGYKKAVLVAFAEVEDQLAAITFIQEQAIDLDAQEQALKEALRIAHNRYRTGYATYLEELDAQRSLFTVEQLKIQLRSELLVAIVNLYRALGGSWSL